MFALSGGSSSELISVCEKATRIASVGYIFMGFSVAVQGVLQALRYAFKPFLTALLRLAVFVFPIAYLFTLSSDVVDVVWWAFPISEALTAVVSLFILKDVMKKNKSVTADEAVEKTVGIWTGQMRSALRGLVVEDKD